jgi:UDP-N-acetylglucosamine 2-epimerase (non-hydrolysing)
MDLEVRLVRFNRAMKLIEGNDLLAGRDHVRLVGPYGFLDYLDLQYQARAIVSDSGTSQEECPLLGVPVAVPRDFTERPESVEFGNSILIGETRPVNEMLDNSLRFFDDYKISDDRLAWLGDGTTSQTIVDILKKELPK